MTNGLDKYRDMFLEETNKNLESINHALIQLEKEPDNKKLLHSIFRDTHTIKGLSETMHFQQLTQLTHAVEDVLSLIKLKQIKLSECTSLLFSSYDHINASLKEIEKSGHELDSKELLIQLQLLYQRKESQDQIIKPEEVDTTPTAKVKHIDVKVEVLDLLINVAEGFLAMQLQFDKIQNRLNDDELRLANIGLGRLINEFQYYTMQVRLVPIDTVFRRYLRMTRDLAVAQNKKVDLEILGNDIELDRTVIEEISESITHLIRNAIDHGIEPASVRKKEHKPATAKIILSAERTKDNAIITIEDDGSGIDVAALKKEAIAQGRLHANVPTDEVNKIIFSGVSSNKEVTEFSGRGLGLDIVRQKIESLGGHVQVKTAPGKWTKFILEVPLNIAIVKILLIKVDSDIYGIPIRNVERIVSIIPKQLHQFIHERAIEYKGMQIPLMMLSELFNHRAPQLEQIHVIVTKIRDNYLALAVDEILFIQDVIVKPLQTNLESSFFSGAAVYGSGEMILILDINYFYQHTFEYDKGIGGHISHESQ